MKNPNPDQGERYEIPVWNQDVKLYEDYQVGEVDRSLRRTISEGEVMLFNSLVLDMHPYVGDDIWAREHGLFKKRLVPGAMVFSYGLGLFAHNNVNTFSYLPVLSLIPWECTLSCATPMDSSLILVAVAMSPTFTPVTPIAASILFVFFDSWYVFRSLLLPYVATQYKSV